MKSNRIQAVDALRGFSLAGIVIVHMVENYVGSLAPADALTATNQGILDSIIEGFIFFFLRGKFFALFSFLFGLSFFIQMDSGSKKHHRFEGRFLWKLVLLLVIGAVHHLFYRGDILTIYAMLGILLIPFYKVSPKWILITAAILFLGVGRYLVFALVGTDTMFSGMEFRPDHPAVIAYFDTIKEGTILQVFESNTIEGHLMKLDFQLGVFGRGYLTFGFFLLGLYLGKLDFFRNFTSYRKKLFKFLYWSIGLLLVSFILAGLSFFLAGPGEEGGGNMDSFISMIGLTFYDLSNLFMTFIIVISFLLIYMNFKGERFLSKFAPYGRMALTNYLAQTLLGTALLYGWGLAYIGELRHVYTLLIALVIIVAQMYVSKWWLAHFNYGPLEWLWRSLTYFKWFKMKKDSH
ncbi:MAG: DUF418 domain-containing protein [bacterium]